MGKNAQVAVTRASLSGAGGACDELGAFYRNHSATFLQGHVFGSGRTMSSPEACLLAAVASDAPVSGSLLIGYHASSLLADSLLATPVMSHSR